MEAHPLSIDSILFIATLGMLIFSTWPSLARHTWLHGPVARHRPPSVAERAPAIGAAIVRRCVDRVLFRVKPQAARWRLKAARLLRFGSMTSTSQLGAA